MLPALPTPTTSGPRAATAGLSSLQLMTSAEPGRLWRRRAFSLPWVEPLVVLLQALPARVALLVANAFAPSARRLLAPLLVVALLLSGCGSGAQPPRRVVLDALALQIRLTQDQVAQALRLEPVGLPEVSRVRVEEQQPIAIGEARGLRLTGRFDWRLAEDPIRVDSPFELYLQRGERGRSWRLARPLAVEADGTQAWITEPLPLPGERQARRAAAPASGSGGAG
ncbi:hypothetical protein [Synechococcus sp. CBW1004]|uniref:hypothetical protein n=1 Tax=Synechococcus sp. CBW1004 TaxID=1353136 RepID=UPI00351B32A2